MVAFDQEVKFENVQKVYYTNVIKALLAGGEKEIRLGMEKLAKIPDPIHRLNKAYRNESDVPPWHCGWGWLKSLVKKSPWHPIEIVQEFFEVFDGGMPMAYAMSAVPGQAYSQVTESFKQWESVNPKNKPIIMALKGWHGDGTALTPEVINGSYKATTDLRDTGKNVVGAAFWHAHSLTTHAYPQALEAYNQLKPWTNLPETERHSRTFSEYGENIDRFAKANPNMVLSIIEEAKNFDEQMRKLGYNSEQPPEFLLPLATPLLNVLSSSVSTPEKLIEITDGAESLHRGIQKRSFMLNSGHSRSLFESVREALNPKNNL
jgi:hypothetical protein